MVRCRDYLVCIIRSGYIIRQRFTLGTKYRVKQRAAAAAEGGHYFGIIAHKRPRAGRAREKKGKNEADGPPTLSPSYAILHSLLFSRFIAHHMRERESIKK